MNTIKRSHHLYDCIYTLLLLIVSTFFCFLLFRFTSANTTNVALTYVIALLIVARKTNGYTYGIAFAVLSVLSINIFFTKPYFHLSFEPSGYPVTFLATLIITIITSARTSHLKIQEQMIREREEHLRLSDKEHMRANLLRAVSHDLRTPLTSILGTSSNGLDNASNLSSAEVKEMMTEINEDANWLLNMVENLLSITRIDGKELKVHKSMEVLEEVVSEAVFRFKKRRPNAKLQVTSPQEMILLPMDPLLIEQVIINLLDNSYLHSESLEPIDFVILVNEISVTFQIRDYGKGIDSDKLNTLFDGSADVTVATNGKRGMGIGLSICKTIIEAHDGTIYVQNRSRGAEFIFVLPLDIKEDDK